MGANADFLPADPYAFLDDVGSAASDVEYDSSQFWMDPSAGDVLPAEPEP